MWLHIWFVDCWEIDFEINLSFFCRLVLKQLTACNITAAKSTKNKRIKQIRGQTDLTQKDKSISKTIANIICALFLFGSASLFFFFFFNCLIIHLRALIYPPSSALYVRPLCETFSWIPNELVAYKVFLPGKAPIYGHVCLFFININPLGEERPYAVFSRTVPGTSLGGKSHCFS